jgi:energy-coupling factor transport system ATP-binding protein
MREFIDIKDVSYTYKAYSEGKQDILALEDINIKIFPGEFVVILGRNGSGKSTLARLINALLIPTKGVVIVKNIDTKDEQLVWDIRKAAGMVFQNPDNQIVGTVVEEDVAFGPENLGVESTEIRKRVDEALQTVGISEYAKHAPHLLSGGQKQRVAIAGILATKPECIILDEATSMLDPIGRREVIQVLKKLNRDEKITIIHITHHMDEATIADRVIVINKGHQVLDGTPQEVFSNVKRIKDFGLDVPQVTELFDELRKAGINLPDKILNVDDAFNYLKKLVHD